jgi:hypothetical protein
MSRSLVNEIALAVLESEILRKARRELCVPEEFFADLIRLSRPLSVFWLKRAACDCIAAARHCTIASLPVAGHSRILPHRFSDKDLEDLTIDTLDQLRLILGHRRTIAIAH